MYDEQIKLLGEETTVNIPGQGREKKQTERTVFAKVLSIGMNEFYQAQSTGLKPELKFEIADYLDYKNEKELVYNKVKYQVLRTYRKNKRQLEITVYGGVNIGTA
jgi:phage head-tail adaptor, putative, SPP1 family|nr:MAG TPA: head closure knob [Caudoviricetes sp.]